MATTNRMLPTALAVLAGLAVLAFMWWLSAVFVPLGIGFVVAFALSPAVDWLQRFVGSRTRAAAVLLTSFAVLALGILGASVPMVAAEVRHWTHAVSGEGAPGVPLGLTLVDYGDWADADAESWQAVALVASARQLGAPPEVLRVLNAAGTSPAADSPLAGRTLAEALGDHDEDGQLDPGYGKRLRALARDRKSWLGDAMHRLEKAGLVREAERAWRKWTARDQVNKLLAEAPWATAGDWGKRALGSLGAILAAALGLAVATVLIPLYSFFFLLALPRWKAHVPAYLPRAHRERAMHILRRIAGAIAAFVRGRLVVCAIVGVVTALGWALLGVRLGFLGGLAVGVLTLVPLANVVALVPVLLMSLLDVAAGAHGTGWLAGVVGVYVFGQVAESVLNPLIVGDAVQLDIVTLVVALLIGGAVAGFFGLLLAVPVAATVKILAEELLLPRWRTWAEGDAQPPTAP